MRANEGPLRGDGPFNRSEILDNDDDVVFVFGGRREGGVFSHAALAGVNGNVELIIKRFGMEQRRDGYDGELDWICKIEEFQCTAADKDDEL